MLYRIISGGVALSLLASVALVTSCSTCSNTLRSKTLSSDGRLAAVFSERNCGATTDFSSIVNVQTASDRFDSDQGVLFVAKGHYDIAVAWSGPRALLVTCAACSRKNIFREVTALGDIAVRYSLGPDSAKPAERADTVDLKERTKPGDGRNPVTRQNVAPFFPN